MSENGHVPVQTIPLNWSGRMMTDSPDGTRVTFRAICLAQYPEGTREVCTVEVKIWEGGADMLRNCAPQAAQLAVQLATQQISGLITRV